MQGFDSSQPESANRPRWEHLTTEAVGDVIQFWGFKRNHGRVWALLYLYDEPMTARQIRERLDLSKGGVSIITGELDDWGVIRILEPEESRARQFRARSDFFSMVKRVLEHREEKLVDRIADDLSDACHLAEQDGDVDEATLTRLKRMRRMASFMQQALHLFLDKALFDISATKDML